MGVRLLIANHLDQSIWLANERKGVAIKSYLLHSSLASVKLCCAVYQPELTVHECWVKLVHILSIYGNACTYHTHTHTHTLHTKICKRILVMTTMTQNPNKGITIKIYLSSFWAALFSISCSHNEVHQVSEPVATLKFPYSSTLNPKILLTVNSSSKYLLSSKFLQLQSSSSSTLPKKFSSPSRALLSTPLALSLSIAKDLVSFSS